MEEKCMLSRQQGYMKQQSYPSWTTQDQSKSPAPHPKSQPQHTKYKGRKSVCFLGKRVSMWARQGIPGVLEAWLMYWREKTRFPDLRKGINYDNQINTNIRSVHSPFLVVHVLKEENQIGMDFNRNWYAHVRQLGELMLHEFNTLEPIVYNRANTLIFLSQYSSFTHSITTDKWNFWFSKICLRKPLNFSTKSHTRKSCIRGWTLFGDASSVAFHRFTTFAMKSVFCVRFPTSLYRCSRWLCWLW